MLNQQQKDVVILGGGLAAMTLALELKQNRPETDVLILEKRHFPVGEAAYKIGESTIEVSAHYFTKVLGLAKALRTAKLPKLGLRYFFNNGDNAPIETRAEVGQTHFPVVNTFNFDRGRMENIIFEECRNYGVRFEEGALVKEIDLGNKDLRITYQQTDEVHLVKARWVVDGSGRTALLKRKLNLKESNDHNVNAVWFRIDQPITADNYSDDREWQSRIPFHLRNLSTTHMMGAGYWIWMIPLSSGSTSIGIVADETLHPLREMNSFEKTLSWLDTHEPQLGGLVSKNQEYLQDFAALRHFSYGCKQVFSEEGWCLTGDAGPFPDPFYSPGSDFIAYANGFITAMVKQDLAGEDVTEMAISYNNMYLNLYRTYMLLYQDQYPMMSNAQVYTAKIVWDFGIYWGTTGLLYFQKKLHDLAFMGKALPVLLQAFQLNEQVQRVFREWHAVDDASWARNLFVNYLEVEFLYDWQTDLVAVLDEEQLLEKLDQNLRILENFVIWMVRRATGTIDRLELDDPEIDPYEVSLSDFEIVEVPVEERRLNIVEELNGLMSQIRNPEPAMVLV